MTGRLGRRRAAGRYRAAEIRRFQAAPRSASHAAVARDVVEDAPVRAHVEPRPAAAEPVSGQRLGALRPASRRTHRGTHCETCRGPLGGTRAGRQCEPAGGQPFSTSSAIARMSLATTSLTATPRCRWPWPGRRGSRRLRGRRRGRRCRSGPGPPPPRSFSSPILWCSCWPCPGPRHPRRARRRCR